MSTSIRNIVDWSNDYRDYVKSDMTVDEWCAAKAISPATFYYRANRLKEVFGKKDFKEKICDVSFLERCAGRQTISIKASGISVKICGNTSIDVINSAKEILRTL